MEKSNLHLIERIVAQPDQVDQLKGWLQRAAEETHKVPGVQQLELFQNGQNPAEFIFFLIVDDLKQNGISNWLKHCRAYLLLLSNG